MEDKRSYGVWILLLALILLPGLYAGSYVALLEPHAVVWVTLGRAPAEWPARYRVGGEIAGRLFHPINLVDRQLRPDHWSFDPERVSTDFDFTIDP